MTKLKQYILSAIILLVICYLSFFKPPSAGSLSTIPHLDKIVHFCMYFGFSSVLWFDYGRDRKIKFNAIKGWGLAFVFPVILSGMIELLQEYCTTYRGGEWLDFTANSCGALVASLLMYYIILPRLRK